MATGLVDLPGRMPGRAPVGTRPRDRVLDAMRLRPGPEGTGPRARPPRRRVPHEGLPVRAVVRAGTRRGDSGLTVQGAPAAWRHACVSMGSRCALSPATAACASAACAVMPQVSELPGRARRSRRRAAPRSSSRGREDEQLTLACHRNAQSSHPGEPRRIANDTPAFHSACRNVIPAPMSLGAACAIA